MINKVFKIKVGKSQNTKPFLCFEGVRHKALTLLVQ